MTGAGPLASSPVSTGRLDGGTRCQPARVLRLVSLRIVRSGLMPALVFSQLVSFSSCLCAQDRAPSLTALCARSVGPPPPPIASPGTSGVGERRHEHVRVRVRGGRNPIPRSCSL